MIDPGTKLKLAQALQPAGFRIINIKVTEGVDGSVDHLELWIRAIWKGEWELVQNEIDNLRQSISSGHGSRASRELSEARRAERSRRRVHI